MRPSLAAVCAALTTCVLSFGCNGSAPFNADNSMSTHVKTLTSTVDPATINQTSTGDSSATLTPVSQAAPAVSVVISDPAACRAPNGAWTHVYVTVADVKASTNPNAGPNDPSFVDLTPGLAAAPKQVDLLGQANSNCFLASLGGTNNVPWGDYQQVRVVLVPDSAASTVANNACGASYANCIVRTDNSLHDLAISSQAASGIEIPVNQIVNGSLTFSTGGQPTVDINFDICSSIMQASNGSYEFRPMVHAGLVDFVGGTIQGTIVSSKTGKALQGGSVVVALEQKSPTTGFDRILMRTTTTENGAFIFCPVPQGTYDLVAVGVDGAGIAYSAGVETGIQSGQIAGQIPLVPGSRQGVLEGTIATQRTTTHPSGTVAAMKADALQQTSSTGPIVTIPLLPSQSAFNEAMLTQRNRTCPAGADCADYSMLLPTEAPNVLACSDQTTQFTQQTGEPPNYTAEAFAQIPGSGAIADCVKSSVEAATTPGGSSLLLNPGQTTTAATLAFTECN
jgi:hypothetical protein